jgi:hypothetical protein
VGLLVMAGMVFPIGMGTALVQAQDDWDVPKKPVDRPNQNFRFAMPDFDQWVLGGRNRGQSEDMLKSQLTLRIESANRVCELTAAQREKLRLAAEGDLKRLARAIDEARDKYREVGQDQQKYNAFINQVSKLQIKMQSDVFDESSLYQKVLRQTLNHEQSVRYEQQERERRKFRYEAKIEMVLSNFENSIALRADQRQRLVKLILDETEPPKKFGQYDFYVVLIQLARLDDEKLQPILDDAQRQSLQKVFNQYRGMEQYLRTQGYLP